MSKSESKAKLSTKKLKPIEIKQMGYLASSESLPTLKSVGSVGQIPKEFSVVDTLRSSASLKSLPSLETQPKLTKSVKLFAEVHAKEEDLFELPEKVKCLFKNRALVEFDTFDQPMTPEEMLAKCQAMDTKYHALTKTYENKT